MASSDSIKTWTADKPLTDWTSQTAPAVYAYLAPYKEGDCPIAGGDGCWEEYFQRYSFGNNFTWGSNAIEFVTFENYAGVVFRIFDMGHPADACGGLS